MAQFLADPLKCTKCGICVKVCPSQLISIGEGGFPEMPRSLGGHCIECGHCELFCPSGAAHISCVKSAELVNSESIKLPSAEEALNFLRTRRSIRNFKEEAVPEDVVRRILDTVKSAPSACNAQTVRWIVSGSREKTHDITKLALEWLRGEIFKDPTSRLGILGVAIMAQAKQGRDVLLRAAPQAAIAVVPKDYGWPEDGSIALTYFELAAHALGVGACWGGFLTMAVRSYPELRKYLGINDSEHICGAQLFGWPSLTPVSQFAPRHEQNINWL